MLVVTHVHEDDGDGQADAQVVSVRLFHWQEGPRQQQEEAADSSHNTQPARNEADGLEAVRICPVRHGARQAATHSSGELLADPAFCVYLAVSGAARRPSKKYDLQPREWLNNSAWKKGGGHEPAKGSPLNDILAHFLPSLGGDG